MNKTSVLDFSSEPNELQRQMLRQEADVSVRRGEARTMPVLS